MRTPILGNSKQKLDSIWQALSPDAQVLSIFARSGFVVSSDIHRRIGGDCRTAK
jgi:hypothetical protein